MNTEPRRPLLRYHGGKWKLAPWIISHFPHHRCYVEPFGGAASVLLRKTRSYAEVYNDLDGEIVNLFRVLRNPAQARELVRLVKLTPYAREEFDLSYIIADDPVEQARRTLFRSAAGFATGAQGRYGTGFRNNVSRTGGTPSSNWQDYPKALEQIVERLQGVIIENRSAADLVGIFDEKETLFYCDPPYPFGTRNKRSAGDVYRHEMTDDDHRQMAEVLRSVQGMVVVSGYACLLYDNELFSDWHRVERTAYGDGAVERTEVLWISPTTWAALHQSVDHLPLFGGK